MCEPEMSMPQPMFDALESRVLLATVAWDGGAGTDSWHDAMNWDGDVLPGPTDDVVINVPGDQTIEFTTGITIVKSLDNSEMFDLSAGTLFVNGNWIQRDLMTMTGGIVDGTGDLVVKNGLEWSGGVMRGNRTIIEAASFAVISDTVSLERIFKNFGVVSWTGGNIKFNDGTLNTIGLLTVSSDGAALHSDGVNFFANNGNMIRQNAGGVDTQTIVDVPFVSNDSLALSSGNLRFNSTSEFHGPLVVQPDTLVRFFSPTLLSNNSTVTSAGVISFVNTSGHVIDTSIEDIDELVIADGASVSLSGNAGEVARLDIDGQLTDIGSLTITERLRIFDGHVTGNGSITIADAALMTLDLSGSFNQDVSVDNHGTLILKQGTWILEAVTIHNHAEMFLRSGTITHTNIPFSTSLIENHPGAEITKHTPAMVSILGAAFNKKVHVSNHGLIQAIEGTLEFDGGGTSHADGTLKAGADATLMFDDRDFAIYGNVEGDGTFQVVNHGDLNWNVPLGGIRHLTIDQGGDVNLLLGGTIERLALSGELTVIGAPLGVTERFDFFSGKINGSTQLDIHADALLVIDGGGANQHIDVVNNGTVILKNDADWQLHTIDLVNNADLFIRSGEIEAWNGLSNIVNAGVITKHTDAFSQIRARTQFDQARLTNTGDIRVNEGTLEIRGGGSSTGVIKAGAAGTIDFTTRTFTIAGGSVVGDGVVNLNITTQGAAWHAGTISVNTLRIDRNVTLETTGEKILDVDSLVLSAGLIWQRGILQFHADTATITGTLHLESDDAFLATGNTAITVAEGGRLLQLGTNIVDFGPTTTLHNLGTVKVTSGGLQFAAGTVQNLNVNNSLIIGTWVVVQTGALDLGEPVVKNFATSITLRGNGSNFVNLTGLTENQGTIFIHDNYALHVNADFVNKATIDFDAGGTLHVNGDYVSGAGATTRFDVSDINGGIIFATGQAHLAGLFRGTWGTPMNNPPVYIRLVNAAMVFDNAPVVTFIDPPLGFDVTLDFEHPARARIKFTPF